MTRPLTLDDGERGLAEVEKIIAADPGNQKAHDAKYLLLLSLGRLAEGWAEYDWHLTAKSKVTYGAFPVPRLRRGEIPAGKHVLVWTEHGIGDQIFQAGMFNDLLDCAASVTIFCSRRLVPVFRRSFPGATVYRVGDKVPDRVARWNFDCQMSIADAGAAFRKNLDFTTKPFLIADADKMRMLRERYAQTGKRLIGLSWWSNNPLHGIGKCTRLSEMAPVFELKDVVFVSLQYGDNRAEIADAEQRFGVQIINDTTFNQLTDMDTFVAQVASMDHVVSISATTAHVAGALGVPGSVLLPSEDAGLFWCWHTKRSDSP